SDPAVMRRLRSMAVLDPGIGEGIRARDARRPHIPIEILKSWGRGDKKTLRTQQRVASEASGVITGFETYVGFGAARESEGEIVATLTRLARCAAAEVLNSRADPGRSNE